MVSLATTGARARRVVRFAAMMGLGAGVAAAGPDNTTSAAVPDAAPTDIGTVSAQGGGGGQPAPGSPAAVAPSAPPLNAAQPTSVVGPQFIQNGTVPTENYDSIIKFTPSVQNVEPTGAGLQQDFQQTIRGFRYTQFNSTFDGLVLPGTISSFAPQTGAYFLGHDIQSVSVDRGPGTASQIGYATFGGTVATTLVSPSPTPGVNPYTTAGSLGLGLEGLRLDTGALPQLGGAMGMLDLQHVEANGYLTGTSTLRNNAYGKVEVPVGDSTVITFEGMYDYARTHTPYGATLQQIQTLGPNYALNNNPSSQAYTGYNNDSYYTDFDYIGIKSALGDGWGLDDKAYTVSYYHHDTQGEDPNGTTPNLNGTIYLNGVKTSVVNNVPGFDNHSDFRAWGNTLRMSKDTDYGQLRFGLWFDYDSGSSWKENIDLTDGNTPYTTKATAIPVSTLLNPSLTTVQPYIEFAAKPLPDLTITPGVKYTYVLRELNATIISSKPSTAPGSQSWDKFQPSIDVHYSIRKDWSAYLQVAEGFLAPPLNILEVPAANAPSSVKPETTVNYQIGTTFQSGRFSAGFDMYYIQFQNYIAAEANNQGTIYTNNGGAVFKGIEAEGSAKIWRGLSLYGNATVNDATYDNSGFPVALTPRTTAAAGPIVQQGGLYGYFLWKYVGPQYTLDGSGPLSQPSSPIAGYNDADFAAGYSLVLPQLNDRKLNFRLNVLNVFDNHSLTGIFGTTAAGAALYATNPGRGVFVSISASL